MVRRLIRQGFLRSPPIREAMLKVPRERFVPLQYRDYAYQEVPLPLPGDGRNQTISCPHSYPLFYEALELGRGDAFLEVGTGSGYGAALAMEIVRDGGKVVTVEMNETTCEFARANLRELGYAEVIVVLGDGSEGYAPESPYDKICVTASCPRIPEPLVEQLLPGGKLLAPVGPPEWPQKLTLLEKGEDLRIEVSVIEQVLYVPLFGRFGWSASGQ
ncbi:MAG: protein-L-isoaspartate(D-aspartate) O-methyltransferase [Candidatus Brockarchaeota archaeon]|nr:protein-L-isoaspartate(D-aspartate) O-methyltransferase [Candidatus Brockarchaeota archaeon]